MIKFNISIGDIIWGLSELLHKGCIICTDEDEAELIQFKLEARKWPIVDYNITLNDQPIARISVKHLNDGQMEVVHFEVYKDAFGKVIPPIVGVAEAAELLNWKRQNVNNHMKRGTFPQPIERLASGPVWLASQIEKYKEEKEENDE